MDPILFWLAYFGLCVVAGAVAGAVVWKAQLRCCKNRMDICLVLLILEFIDIVKDQKLEPEVTK